MRRYVESLILIKKLYKYYEKDSWYKPPKLELRPKEILTLDLTRTDIETLIRYNIINLKTLNKKVIMKLLLDGKLDFYKVSSIKIKRQFTKDELLEIINSKYFNRNAKAGMLCEPVHILNKRTLILHQDALTLDIVSKINSDGEMDNTLKHHRKKIIKKSKINKDKNLELYIECL